MMKKKVLLIEDEPDDALMFRIQFEHEGFEVMITETAEEGLQKARNEMPDIILLDIVLRNEDKTTARADDLEYSGIRLLNELKRDPHTATIPIIILTNLERNTYKPKTKEMGADDYLVKSELLPDEIVRRASMRLQQTSE